MLAAVHWRNTGMPCSVKPQPGCRDAATQAAEGTAKATALQQDFVIVQHGMPVLRLHTAAHTTCQHA